MKRRLLATLAGCLALPALGLAQSDGFTIPNAPIYPTARPTKPVILTPTRAPSPYNAQPLLPSNEPRPLRYPSQEIPVPLPASLAPQARPMGMTPPLGRPQSSAATSYKNPGEVRFDLPQEGKSSTPALGAPEATKSPAIKDESKSIPNMNPNVGQPGPAPTLGAPRQVVPNTTPVVPSDRPTPSPMTTPTQTVPTPAPTSYPASRAEAIIRTPMSASFNSCVTCEPTGCGPDGRAWIGAEYLYWTAKGASAPPLVSTSPAGTPITNAGVLGTPGASTFFGGGNLNNQWRSGVRLRAGFWLNQAQTIGFEASGFYLGQDATDFRASSPGSPILSRPFLNTQTGLPAAELVAFPGVLSGTASVSSGSNLYGFGPSLLFNLCCNCDSRVDLLVGYRYLRLRDGITIREDLLATDPAGVRAPLGTQITVIDTFNTTNTFNGGLIGLAGEKRFGNFFLSGRVSVAAGNTHQQVNINGMTQIRSPDGTRTNLVGGLLAQRTNIGTYGFDAFSIVPEVGVSLGYQVSQNVRIFGGYNFLYWTNVSRAAEQIDPGVNPTGIPRAVPPSTLQGAPRPAFINRENDYWLHGVSAGVEFRF